MINTALILDTDVAVDVFDCMFSVFCVVLSSCQYGRLDGWR